MKVAIFADVHGNLVALEQLIRATSGVVDGYVCLGDVVNYGPWNDECLELIHGLPEVTILQGNHERLFQGDEGIEESIPLVKEFSSHSRKFFSRWDLIADLPVSCDVGLFRCEHTIDGQIIYPDTPLQVERDYFVGHSHHQYRIERSGCVIANPGSVGQNRQWIDMVDYAVFDTDNSEICFHSIVYDVDSFLCELRARRYPRVCIDYYAEKARRNG